MKKKQRYTNRQVMLSSDYEIFYYKDAYANEVTLHHHDFYEIYFFLSGEVKYMIEGKIYKLLPGDIVIINSNELHQPLFEDSSKSYERIVLWIDKEFVKSLSTGKTNLAACFESPELNSRNVLRLPLEAQQSLRLAFMKLLNSTGSKGFGSDICSKIYVSDILIMITQMLIEKEKVTQQIRVSTKNDALIQSVIAFIEENLNGDISLDSIASEFYISKFYLSRVFKAHTSTTIHRYIVQKKLINAKELILKNLPLTEVYKRVGFGDYCNFFRAFKAEYGITPKEFYGYMKENARSSSSIEGAVK